MRRVIVGLSMVLAASAWALPVEPCLPHDDPGPVDHLQRALTLSEEQDLEGALAEARRACFHDRTSAVALELVVRSAHALHRRELAWASLVELVGLVEVDVELLNDLSRDMLKSEDARAALLLSEASITRAPAEAEPYHLRGRARLMLGYVAEAGADFESAAVLNSRHAWALNNLGYVRLLQERAEEALPALQRAAELAPQLAYVQNNLGIAHERLGQMEEARAAFARAVALAPRHAKATENLARATEAVGSGRVTVQDELEAMRLDSPLSGPTALWGVLHSDSPKAPADDLAGSDVATTARAAEPASR